MVAAASRAGLVAAATVASRVGLVEAAAAFALAQLEGVAADRAPSVLWSSYDADQAPLARRSQIQRWGA